MAIKKTAQKKAVAKKAPQVKLAEPVVATPAPVKKAPLKKAAKVAKKAVAKKAVEKKAAPVIVEDAKPVKAAAPAKAVAKPAAVAVKYTDVQKEVITEMQTSGAQLIISAGTGSGLSKDPTSKEYVIFKGIHTNTGKALVKLNLVKKTGKGGLIHSLTKKGATIKF